jgi:hypothetical protein
MNSPEGTTHGHAGRHPGPLGDQVSDGNVNVREGGARVGDELFGGFEKLDVRIFHSRQAFIVGYVGIDDLIRPI